MSYTLETVQTTYRYIFTVRLHVMQRTVLPRPFCTSIYLCLSNAWIVTKRKKLVPT